MSARRATWPNGEWGYSTRRHVLEPVRPEAVLPDRALCLPTFSHLLIVDKTSDVLVVENVQKLAKFIYRPMGSNSRSEPQDWKS